MDYELVAEQMEQLIKAVRAANDGARPTPDEQPVLFQFVHYRKEMAARSADRPFLQAARNAAFEKLKRNWAALVQELPQNNEPVSQALNDLWDKVGDDG